MKQLRYIFMAFAVALFATSCSQDELLEDGGDAPVTGQTQTYTFTVSPDIVMEGDAKTRTPTATTDDQPTRCYMQVYDAAGVTKVTDPIAGTSSNDNYTFTVELASNAEYTYLFWADNGNQDISNLTAVPYQAGTVAYAYHTTGTPEEVTGTTVSLKHAVTKLTLQTTTETSAEAGEAVRVTATCASSYNVAAPANSTFSQQTLVKTFEGPTNVAANKEVASFYFISKDEAQSVDVEFHLLKQTIESVPLAANTHVYLQGDLSEDNPKWGATSKYVEKQIDFFFKDENGMSEGTTEGGVDRFYLPEGNIKDLEAVLSVIFHKNVKLDLTTTGGNIFNEVLDDNYTFVIRHNDISKALYIYINENSAYHIYYDSGYKGVYNDFSNVSDKLNSPAE